MAARVVALLLLAGSLLPVAAWIPSGLSDPNYWPRLRDWMQGAALCAVVGVLAAYIAHARRRRTGTVTGPGGHGGGGPGPVGEAADPTPEPTVAQGPQSAPGGAGFIVLTAAFAFALYAGVARWVFAGRPLLVDEVVQVLQARWYAAGRLWVPAAPAPEFFSTIHVVDLTDRVFGQFPAGGPAMLALGSLVGAEWLVGPAVGALSVLLFWTLLPFLEPGASRRWRRGATLLFAATPFGAFMFGSHMNHATVLMWLLLASVALARATREEDPSPLWGGLTGLALGIAATIRPLDAACFALPAAAWLLWRARLGGGRPLASLLLSGVGVAVPIALLLWVNSETTGSPFLFGYDLLWGAGHSLGFHASPWGPIHTPQRGVELISLYLTRLSTYLFESPFPSLLIPAAGLWLAPRLRPLDRYLLASAGLLCVGYWAYWHDGFFLGPRFLFPLLPLLVLWSARLPGALAARIGTQGPAWIGLRGALLTGVVLALIELAVIRVPSYRSGLTFMRLDVERESARAGVRDALVLVKESWGTRLVVRMWALGVSRSEAEVFYRNSDACKLELTLRALERSGARGRTAADRLRPLLADSAALVPSDRSPDDTERVLPGYSYAPECEAQLQLDQRGYAHLAPFLLAQDSNVYARWLPGREREIAARYPGRDVYLLSRTGPEDAAGLHWEPLAPDVTR
jgi:hypothetical protein